MALRRITISGNIRGHAPPRPVSCRRGPGPGSSSSDVTDAGLTGRRDAPASRWLSNSARRSTTASRVSKRGGATRRATRALVWLGDVLAQLGRTDEAKARYAQAAAADASAVPVGENDIGLSTA